MRTFLLKKTIIETWISPEYDSNNTYFFDIFCASLGKINFNSINLKWKSCVKNQIENQLTIALNA